MKIKCLKDLYNKDGKCFSKNKTYEVFCSFIPDIKSDLADRTIDNDLGQNQCIGKYWKKFEIINC